MIHYYIHTLSVLGNSLLGCKEYIINTVNSLVFLKVRSTSPLTVPLRLFLLFFHSGVVEECEESNIDQS